MLNVACFVQSCLTDAGFVIFSNYCLIGTRLKGGFFLAVGSQSLPRTAKSKSIDGALPTLFSVCSSYSRLRAA